MKLSGKEKFKQKPYGNSGEKEVGSEKSMVIMTEIRPLGVLAERSVSVVRRKTILSFRGQRNK